MNVPWKQRKNCGMGKGRKPGGRYRGKHGRTVLKTEKRARAGLRGRGNHLQRSRSRTLQIALASEHRPQIGQNL
jgi:hypothetical protein